MSDQKDADRFLNRWSTRKQQSARRGSGDHSIAETVPGVSGKSERPERLDSPVSLSEELLPGNSSANRLQRAEANWHDTKSNVLHTVEHDTGSMPVDQAPVQLTDVDMPDVETLTANSDISGFFSKGVSAALRKAALRHVFRQPSYNVRDGLDDYDDDYTVFEPLGDTVTADMKFHAARKERTRLENELLAEEQTQMESGTPDSAETVQKDIPEDEQPSIAEPAEVEIIADREVGSGDVHDRHPYSRVAAQKDSSRDAEQSHEQPEDESSDTTNPVNKTSLATASQPCETPNE